MTTEQRPIPPFPSRFKSAGAYQDARAKYEEQIAEFEERRAYQRRRKQLMHLAGRVTEASRDSLDE